MELGMRLVAPQTLSIWDVDRYGLTIHRANSRMRLLPYEHLIETNELGMRDLDRSGPRVPHQKRILVLGDSFMEAVQVPFEDTFPRQLRRVLAGACSGNVDVLNGSVSGWGTDEELTFLRKHGRDLAPDLVLVAVTLHNDVSDNLRMEFNELRDGRVVEKRVEPLTDRQLFILRLKAFLAGHSHLYQFAYRRWIASRVRQGATELDHHVAEILADDPALASGWVLTLGLFDEVRATAANLGARLALVLIPIRMQLSSESPAAGDAPQRRILEWGRSRDIPVIDLLPEFRDWTRQGKAPLYLERDGHWTPEGHVLAAQVTARQVLRRGQLPGCTDGRAN
jgi:hypothetical protein